MFPLSQRRTHGTLVEAQEKAARLVVEVAAMLEAEPLVVRADALVVTQAVEAQERTSCDRRAAVCPLDERGAETTPGIVATNGELVHVVRIRRLLSPVDRIVCEDGDRGHHFAVQLGDIELPALDRCRKILSRVGKGPLLVTELPDPDGRLFEQTCNRLDLFAPCEPDHHSTSIASPNE